MSFQIKDFRSIAASMINHMRAVQTKVTDFNVGSVVRTLLEAIATEIDELYQQFFNGVREAVPVAIYRSFKFEKLPAQFASGLIRVVITSAANDSLIPSGTVFTQVGGSALKFVSQVDLVITAGNTTVDVYVVALSKGAAGNIIASQHFTALPSVDGFVSASNLLAFNNGADEESDEQRHWRFVEFIATLNRGTVAAIAFGLKTVNIKDASGHVTESVRMAAVTEPYLLNNTQPIAWVRCFIHNGVNGASGALLSRAHEVITGYYDALGRAVPGWKAAGVRVDIEVATQVLINVSGELTPLPGYVTAPLLTQAMALIANYIGACDIGKPALHAEMIALVMGLPGVYDVKISAPVGNTVATISQKLMPGVIVITAAA